MGKAPAYQMYAQDFDMDTASWPNVAVGIYQRLLNYEWINCGLPKELEELARVAREKRKIFEKNWIKFVSQKFHENGNGFLVNKRLEEVRQIQSKYSESRRKNVSIRYKDKATHEPTYEEHSSYINPTLQSSSSSSTSKDKKNKDIYGEFQNVRFTEEEYQKLLLRFGELGIKERIQNLSEYIASKGKKYSSHYATILSWERLHPERIETIPTDKTDRLIYEMKKEREKDGHS